MAIKAAIKNFQAALAKAKAETTEIKDDLRPQRMKEKIRPGVMDAYKRFDEARADLKRRAGNLSGIIDKVLEIKQPESEIKQLIRMMQFQEIRRGLVAMPAEKHRDVCEQKAAAGDRAFFDAVRESPFEIVNPHIMSAMQAEFMRQAADNDRNVKIALEGSETLRDEAESLDFEIRQAEKFIRETLTSEKINTLSEPIEKMTSKQSTEYISKHGIESFRAMFDSGIR